MSTTMQGIDARGYLSGWLQGLTGMYLADIAAIPEDKWAAPFGGCTRPASELTADAISLLKWTSGCMKGSAPTGDYGEAMNQLNAACATKEGASATFKSACEEFTAALSQASDETLSATVMPPWQMEAPLFMIAQIAVSHVWYHDGQLNYIH